MKRSLRSGAEGKEAYHEIIQCFGCPVLLQILRVIFFSSCYRDFHMGTSNVLVEISRVVEEMLSASEKNDVSCCSGIRSEVRMVGAYDIAEKN